MPQRFSIMSSRHLHKAFVIARVQFPLRRKSNINPIKLQVLLRKGQRWKEQTRWPTILMHTKKGCLHPTFFSWGSFTIVRAVYCTYCFCPLGWKCQWHVGDKAKCRQFLPRQANFGDMVFTVSALFCVTFFRHRWTKDRRQKRGHYLIPMWRLANPKKEDPKSMTNNTSRMPPPIAASPALPPVLLCHRHHAVPCCCHHRPRHRSLRRSCSHSTIGISGSRRQRRCDST